MLTSSNASNGLTLSIRTTKYITRGFFFLLLVLGSLSFDCCAQNSISGEIKALPPGKIQLVLEEDINRKQARLIAEIPVDKSGRFSYKAALSPNIYSLKFSDDKMIMLAIDKDQQIMIKGNMIGNQQWEITGSDDTRKLMNYEAFRKASLARLVSSVRADIRMLKQKGTPDEDSTLKKLTQVEIQNYESHKDELIRFIEKEMGTSVAIYATSIRWGGEKNIPFLLRLARDFELAHPGTAIALKVAEKVRLIEANTTGGKVTDIKMPDQEGTVIPLFSIKAKYVLIDFWASWCLPCRGEAPLVVDLYQRFSPLGLEVYGVSLDTKKDAWIKAIEKDKRTWVNVSTLQGFETPVSFDYAVTSLPSNVLIDHEGRIMARDLHGAELKKFIEKLFEKK
ncbi:MAG TPA: TlpA disulfide reductase family protein [Flavisolibacter sp.]